MTLTAIYRFTIHSIPFVYYYVYVCESDDSIVLHNFNTIFTQCLTNGYILKILEKIVEMYKNTSNKCKKWYFIQLIRHSPNDSEKLMFILYFRLKKKLNSNTITDSCAEEKRICFTTIIIKSERTITSFGTAWNAFN